MILWKTERSRQNFVKNHLKQRNYQKMWVRRNFWFNMNFKNFQDKLAKHISANKFTSYPILLVKFSSSIFMGQENLGQINA